MCGRARCGCWLGYSEWVGATRWVRRFALGVAMELRSVLALAHRVLHYADVSA